jgi:predicted Zn-dependent protease
VNLAYALQGADKPFEAKRIIDKVIALNPGYRHAYITLAKISEKLGDTVGATAALEKAKALSVRAKFIQGDIDRISSGVKN